MADEVAHVLNAAADLLEKDGRCQGFFARDAEGKKVLEYTCSARSYSLMGAILKVTPESSSDGVRETALFVMMCAIKSRSIPLWNDALERTKEQVIEKLREGAKNVEAYI